MPKRSRRYTYTVRPRQPSPTASPGDPCDFCASPRLHRNSPGPVCLWQYGTYFNHHDNLVWHPGAFCCRGCFEDFQRTGGPGAVADRAPGFTPSAPATPLPTVAPSSTVQQFFADYVAGQKTGIK